MLSDDVTRAGNPSIQVPADNADLIADNADFRLPLSADLRSNLRDQRETYCQRNIGPAIHLLFWGFGSFLLFLLPLRKFSR